jgi:DNA-binding NarL/FixJ family response regulator
LDVPLHGSADRDDEDIVGEGAGRSVRVGEAVTVRTPVGERDNEPLGGPSHEISAIERRYEVVLVADREIVRLGLETMLHAVPAVARVRSCSTTDEALAELSSEMAPDFAILAAELETTELEHILTSANDRGVHVLILLRTGAAAEAAGLTGIATSGFLLQTDLTVDRLRTTLEQSQDGQVSMPRELARHLLSRGAPDRPFRLAAPLLTPREREALKFLVEGYSNKQIARSLRISEHGAKRHVASLLAKLNCANRTQAAARALRDESLF